jgi:CIC family chloride channel protein
MHKKILNIYLIAILLGILSGIVSSLFQLSIRGLDALLSSFFQFANNHGLSVSIISALTSMLMVWLAWLMVQHGAPEAAGSGVQEIEGTLLHIRPIFWRRLIPVKFIGGVLALSAKMVLGREGPTIQMGGNLGEMLGEAFRCTRKRRDVLIAAGSAAGLAAAFNAPLAAVLFVIEEMRNQFNFSFINFKIVAISCVMSTIVLHAIIGSQAAIPMAVFALPSLQSLWLFFVLGLFVGVVGWIFNVALMKCLYKMDTLTYRQRQLYVLAVSAGIGYIALTHPSMVGGGYEIIEKSLTMHLTFSMLIIVFIIRFITTLVCYNTGVPGGIFAPMLALGTLFGIAASYILQWLMIDMSVHPGMFAVAGMGALFSAAVRAPVTGIVLVVEMTQNYSLILPLMVSCLTSTTVMQLVGNPPIYTQLLKRAKKNQVEQNG